MAQYDFDLREYWRIIKKKKFIIVFTTIAMGIFSLIFAILGSPTPLYKTSAAVKFERNSLASGIYLQTVTFSPGDDMQTQMAVIKSYFVLEIVGKQLGLIPQNLSSDEIRSNSKYISAINRLKGMVETEQEAQSSIINVNVTSNDPKFAQRLANTIVTVYKEQRTAELNKRTTESKKFVEEQLKIAHERLKNSEDAVRNYREENKLISIDANAGTLMSQIGSYRVAHDKASVDYEKIQDALRHLSRAETQPFTSKTSFYFEEAPPIYKSLNDKLIQLLMDRDSLLITFTENYPQVVEIKQRIHEVVQSMKAQLIAYGNSLRENLHHLKNKIDETDRQIKSLPQKGLELARLERNVKVDTDVYSLLEKSYQESLIKEAEKVEDVQIVRPAFEPTSPVNPPKTKATAGIGTLLGLVLGIVFAFLIETFDTSIGTIEEVENFLGVPVLGVVPQISLKDIKSSLYEKMSGKVDDETAERASRLIAHFAPKSTLAESYRALRTNLNFASRDHDVKTIVLTSATPREGKTTTVVNLAITIAQTGQRVLLVEMDLRKPVIAHMFGIAKTPGLTDVMLGNLDWQNSVKTIADIMMGKFNIDELLETPGMDNLHIIPSGTIPPNPAELINSKSISNFIEWAKSNYDVVLMDAPPVLAATDAALLGSKADGVVIIYRVGKISRVTLKRAKAQLDNVRANVIGTVLNGIKADISPDFADYDYKYYHYYGGKEQEKGFLQKLSSQSSDALDYLRNIFKKKQSMPEEETPSTEIADHTSDGAKNEITKPKKRASGGKLLTLMALIAALALAAGVAYQSGYLNLNIILDPVYNLIGKSNSTRQQVHVQTNGVKKAISRSAITSAPQIPKAAESPAEPAKEAVDSAHHSTSKALPTSNNAPKISAATHVYSIQIKAVRDPDDAVSIVNILSKQGMDAFFQKVDLKDSGIWHRILIGHFANVKAARVYFKTKKMGDAFPGSLVRKVSLKPDVKM